MKQRINYVDGMRGLAMFMVVIYHISFGCFHSGNIITNIINVQYELPLFFFISGFFAERMENKGTWTCILDKILHIIIPTIIMMSLFCWVMDYDLIEGFQKRLKEGYWFTFVLFEFILIYLSTNLFCKTFGLLKAKKWIHLLTGIIFIYLSSFSEKYNQQYSIINILSIGEFKHYIYFIVGSLLFSKKELLNRILESKYVLGICIIICIIANIFGYKYGFAMLRLFAMVTISCLIIIGLIIIWGLFIRYKGLSKGNIIGDFFSLIGKRTLDIYFIHYFILPWNLNTVGTFFSNIDIPFIEYIFAVFIALLVTLTALGIGCIIRLSPFAARWLLGEK